MKKIIMSATVSIVLGSTVMVNAGETKPAETPADSPIRVEMRLLDAAFKNLIDSLLFNNPKTIEEPFHEVHKAKANTEKAIEKGEIKLPKNGDKMNEFVELDEQFHKKLVMVIEASRKGDMKKVREVAHKLLNSCVQCHNRFRN